MRALKNSLFATAISIPLGEDPVIVEVTGSQAIPAVSEWGVICMTLMMLVAGSILMRRLQAVIGVGQTG